MSRQALIALICCVLVLTGAVCLLASQAALVWAVNQAAARTDGKLSATGVTGSLLYGPIEFQELRYRRPGMDVTVTGGRIVLQRWPLLSRKVRLETVEAQSIVLARRATSSHEASTPPQTLRLPVEISVSDLRVQRIAFTDNVEVGPLAAALEMKADQWSMQIASLETVLGIVSAQIRAATDSPFAIEGHAALTHNGP